MPLKFGAQVLEHLVCARAMVEIEDSSGRTAIGWGETPLSVAWVWPSSLTWEEREERLRKLCAEIAQALVGAGEFTDPLEFGHRFQHEILPGLLQAANAGFAAEHAMPHLAALVCLSSFDLAVYDAFGHWHGQPVFNLLGGDFLKHDLSHYLEPATAFRGKYPADFLTPRKSTVPVWHLVGGLDPLEPADLTGHEPKDEHPVLLRDWIRRDGLKCLKFKLKGDDVAWDYDRFVRIATIAAEEGVNWLTADFNCTVTDPAYVVDILDRLLVEHPRAYAMTLYIEQPFPYDLEAHRIDVHGISSRKPLFLDESAHDWKYVRLGRELGWTGVALKTCKTLTGALLSLCWARAHGMSLMVQDLTNPMLAQVPHVLLAAHAGTLMGVECNAMQYYPDVSQPEAAIHPDLYRRRDGVLRLDSVRGPGFGYRVSEIARELPAPAFQA